MPTNVVRTASQMATPQTISPKTVLALVFPAVGTLVLALVNEFVVVHLDSTIKVAVVGVVNAALAALGAYLGAPGQVTVRE
jgi:capsular polysaccharide biosynthesis protein